MSKKRTAYTERAVTAVATLDITEGQALIFDTTGDLEDRVCPASLATQAGTFAGFANMRAKVGQSVGVVQKGYVTAIASGNISQSELLVLGANGTVARRTDASHTAIARAQSNAVNGEPVTIEVNGSF